MGAGAPPLPDRPRSDDIRDEEARAGPETDLGRTWGGSENILPRIFSDGGITPPHVRRPRTHGISQEAEQRGVGRNRKGEWAQTRQRTTGPRWESRGGLRLERRRREEWWWSRGRRRTDEGSRHRSGDGGRQTRVVPSGSSGEESSRLTVKRRARPVIPDTWTARETVARHICGGHSGTSHTGVDREDGVRDRRNKTRRKGRGIENRGHLSDMTSE